MIRNLHLVLEIVSAFAALAGIVYYALCLWGAYRFLAATEPAGTADASLPPVSILKPLKGVDPEIHESFRSHCLQDYPAYEIIFGVSDPNDPAVEEVERLRREFPDRAIKLVICPNILGTNVKISNLVQMLPAARYEALLVNDSDIRVDPNYLRSVVTPLHDASVGMVTCLYRGVPSPTLGSRLESLGISTDFAGGVLSARALEGVRFGLGSTLVFRCADLARIGGFESLLDYLADDYQLGRRIADSGLSVHLSRTVVETFLPAYDFDGFFQHQLRWARSVRDSRRWGYVGLLLTFGWPWALLAVIVSNAARWSWGLLAIAAALRLAQALIVGRSVLKDQFVGRLLALLPLRDLLAVVVWIASFASDRVAWRGSYFRLKDGKLIRVAS